MLRSQKYALMQHTPADTTVIGNDKRRESEEELLWFAMSSPYRRELKARDFLISKNVECFVPMRYAMTEKRNGRKCRQLVPAVHNLIFVHTTRERIKQLKQGVDFLQYRTRPENGKNIPITVPHRDMQQFIAITEKNNEELIYLTPGEIDLKKGTRVRVHGGPFDGTTGLFIKIRGKRSKRVVIEIEGLTAVALAEITPDLIELLP